MEWLSLAVPVAIVGGVTYALIEMIGRNVSSDKSSPTQEAIPEHRAFEVSHRH